MGYSNYTNEYLWKVCTLLKVMKLRKENFPSSPGDYHKLNSSPLFGEEQNYFYQLVGMEEWTTQIGKFDICYAVTSLNCLQRLHGNVVLRG